MAPEARSPTNTPQTDGIIKHPAYCVLYKNNPATLTAFITHAKGLTYEEAEGNQEFRQGLLRAEKGDAVDYRVIEANLPRLSDTKSATRDMERIVDGFKKLLAYRESWLIASVRFWVSECWLLMVRGYFVKHDDPELTRLLVDAPKLAQANFHKYQQQFSNPETMAALQADIDSLRARVAHQLWLLVEHKKAMQRELGTFQEINFKIDEHFVQLACNMFEDINSTEPRDESMGQPKDQTMNQPTTLGRLGRRELAQDVVGLAGSLRADGASGATTAGPSGNAEKDKNEQKDQEYAAEIMFPPFCNKDEECKQHHPQRSYIISFGAGGRMMANNQQSTASLSHAHEHDEHDLNHDDQRAVAAADGDDDDDDKNLRSSVQSLVSLAQRADYNGMACSSNLLLDRATLAWMSTHYGQRKVGSFMDWWKSLYSSDNTAPPSINQDQSKKLQKSKKNKSED